MRPSLLSPGCYATELPVNASERRLTNSIQSEGPSTNILDLESIEVRFPHKAYSFYRSVDRAKHDTRRNTIHVMVYFGASRGCAQCRKRKIRCDLNVGLSVNAILM